MEWTLAELAEKLGARLIGDGSLVIRGVAGIREARPGEITFLANPRYEEFLETTAASAIILHESVTTAPLPALLTPQPYLAFLEVLRLFDLGLSEAPPPGIHPTAVIAPDAVIGRGAAIGPHVVIGAETILGDHCALLAGTYIGPRCRVGDGCLFYPRVIVRKECEIGNRVILHAGAVIGDDGFGFAPVGKEYRKIPQLGKVIVEDDVEIGANTTIDRATTGVTRIGRGSRVDNLVMIAHNVEIGENTIICAQTGISGSARIGRHVTLAGQAGVAGHITIGDDVKVGGQGGVTKSVPAGESVSGYPAMQHGKAQRVYAALRGLPEARKTLRQLQGRVEALERALRELDAGGSASGPQEGESSGP